MSDFLTAAYRVLASERRPMTPQEITALALERRWLFTAGKTPAQTMKSKLSTDILKKRGQSAFQRTDKNLFALRCWDMEEYIAGRYQKALLDEQVVVIPASSLGHYVPGPGLHANPLSTGHRLVGEVVPMSRRKAEEDFSVIQLVSVFVVRYEGLFLTYKRAKRLPEARLHGEYSLIFGGHLNPEDLPTLFDLFAPEVGEAFLTRELEEEVKFITKETPKLNFKGLLYDDARALSRQHLGIVYDVYTPSPRFQIGERGFLIDPKWESLQQVRARLEEFENWSVLLASSGESEKGSKGA